MGKSFTQHDIDKFLSELKKLSVPYKIEKVHQLLNNPNARARYSVKVNHKPFNLFTMSAFIIIGLGVLLFFTVPDKDGITGINKPQKTDPVKSTLADSNLSKGKITASNERPDGYQHAFTKTVPRLKTSEIIDTGSFLSDQVNDKAIPALDSEQGTWSPDTIVNKNRLLLDLSDEEMKAIGIARKGSAIFYHNIIEGEYDWSLTSHPELIPDEERITTFNKFFVLYVTNSQFEPSGPGNFYTSMDTLVPVITGNQGGQIFWFTPHESFFKLLPDRYSYLGDTYRNLICLKRKYPGRSFTNYIEPGSERILEPVNILKLSKEELQKIGVQINDECITFQTRNKNYTLRLCKNGTYSNGNDDDFQSFPPNPYPVLMTDTLGRRLYVINSIINNDSLSRIMNILIPVRIDLSDLVPGRREVIICWYYPAPDLLNSLPKKIGTEIKSELNNITTETKGKSVSCNYFEVCRSSLKLDNFKLYPNPASSVVTIEFENSEEAIGSISIVNMAGFKLRELLPSTAFTSGHNSYQADLSGIPSGMYLILVNTKKGFRTQRLIVSH